MDVRGGPGVSGQHCDGQLPLSIGSAPRGCSQKSEQLQIRLVGKYFED